MASGDNFDDLLEPKPIVFNLDGVVIPDDHAVFKLFPGKTYRLAKAMYDTRHAFLDIQGLVTLPEAVEEWDDDKLLAIISLDRVMREGETHGKRKKKGSGNSQDKKRLGFLKTLFFEAKRGDLILVPLGEGFSSQIAIGELQSDAGVLQKISYQSNDETFETYGRSIKWLSTVYRNKLSSDILKSIHSPTAFHLLGRSWREEIYISAYGTFVFGDIYVAKFPSSKENFSAQDHVNIGALFNGLSVVHDHAPKEINEGFLELAAFEESSITIDLVRNSPISVIVRTVGPLAISAAVMFSAAAEGKTRNDLKRVEVTARAVGSATDRCKLEVPPDVAAAAVGFGVKQFATFCKVRTKVEQETRVKSPAHLKSGN